MLEAARRRGSRRRACSSSGDRAAPTARAAAARRRRRPRVDVYAVAPGARRPGRRGHRGERRATSELCGVLGSRWTPRRARRAPARRRASRRCSAPSSPARDGARASAWLVPWPSAGPRGAVCPLPGTFILHSRRLPALPAGAYTLQRRAGRNAPRCRTSTRSTLHLEVTAPRFALPPDQILSTYPPNRGGRRVLHPPATDRPAPPDAAVGAASRGQRSTPTCHGSPSFCSPTARASSRRACRSRECITPGVASCRPQRRRCVGDCLTVSNRIIAGVFPHLDELGAAGARARGRPDRHRAGPRRRRRLARGRRRQPAAAARPSLQRLPDLAREPGSAPLRGRPPARRHDTAPSTAPRFREQPFIDLPGARALVVHLRRRGRLPVADAGARRRDARHRCRAPAGPRGAKPPPPPRRRTRRRCSPPGTSPSTTRRATASPRRALVPRAALPRPGTRDAARRRTACCRSCTPPTRRGASAPTGGRTSRSPPPSRSAGCSRWPSRASSPRCCCGARGARAVAQRGAARGRARARGARRPRTWAGFAARAGLRLLVGLGADGARRLGPGAARVARTRRCRWTTVDDRATGAASSRRASALATRGSCDAAWRRAPGADADVAGAPLRTAVARWPRPAGAAATGATCCDAAATTDRRRSSSRTRSCVAAAAAVRPAGRRGRGDPARRAAAAGGADVAGPRAAARGRAVPAPRRPTRSCCRRSRSGSSTSTASGPTRSFRARCRSAPSRRSTASSSQALHAAIRDEVDAEERRVRMVGGEDVGRGAGRRDQRLPAALPRRVRAGRRCTCAAYSRTSLPDDADIPFNDAAADAAAAAGAPRAGGAAVPVRRHPDGRAHRGAAAGRAVRRRPRRGRHRDGAPAQRHRRQVRRAAPRPAAAGHRAGAVPEHRHGAPGVDPRRRSRRPASRPADGAIADARRSASTSTPASPAPRSRWRCCSSRSGRCSAPAARRIAAIADAEFAPSIADPDADSEPAEIRPTDASEEGRHHDDDLPARPPLSPAPRSRPSAAGHAVLVPIDVQALWSVAAGTGQQRCRPRRRSP